MSHRAPPGELLSEETTITEITIMPDGRIYVFGTSRQVLNLLEGLRPREVGLGQLMRRVREMETASGADASSPAAATVIHKGGEPLAT